MVLELLLEKNPSQRKGVVQSVGSEFKPHYHKKFCIAKEIITGIKDNLQTGRKIFASYSSDKGLIARLTKSSKN
jgi:hypothetical protein